MSTLVLYHLYCRGFWKEVFERHLALYRRLAPQLSLQVVAYGAEAEVAKWLLSLQTSDLTILLETGLGNEGRTLRHLQQIAEVSHPDRLLGYAHAKGSSYHPEDRPSIHRLSDSLFAQLLRSVSQSEALASEHCFNAFGANAALGIFEKYGLPSFHYSGNFWLAQARYLRSCRSLSEQDIFCHGRRHSAEAWIGTGKDLRPFNHAACFVDGYHYPVAFTGGQKPRWPVDVTDQQILLLMFRQMEHLAAQMRQITGNAEGIRPLMRRICHHLAGVRGLYPVLDRALPPGRTGQYAHFFLPDTWQVAQLAANGFMLES